MTSHASVVTAAKPKTLGKLRTSRRGEIIRQFTPNWFTATMGTGITALAINQLPLSLPGLHGIGTALWLFNIALFVLFAALYAARWIFFFDEASRIFGHSVVSMFFGAIPMALPLSSTVSSSLAPTCSAMSPQSSSQRCSGGSTWRWRSCAASRSRS